MKKLRFICGILLAGMLIHSSAFAQQNDIKELEIGASAPMLEQPVLDVSGEMLTMKETAKENGLLVIFSCNTCPWVDRWEDRYPVVSELASDNEIGMIALNSNEDYRERGDSMEDMIKRAEKADYDFPYALDEDHKIADAFGASKTPHVFLFNSDMKLVYVGAIDDNARSAEGVEEFYLKNAIEQLTSGEEITKAKTRSLGCTIKRVD